MFCEVCGQLIAFNCDTDELVHKTAGTYPQLNDHEPVMSESDAARFHDRLEDSCG